MWAGRHVVLGVSGGIACYKSCFLARRLVEAGAMVDAVLAQSAAEFVRPVTFEALTGRPVLTSLWDRGGALAHIQLGRAPEVARRFVVIEAVQEPDAVVEVDLRFGVRGRDREVIGAHAREELGGRGL